MNHQIVEEAHTTILDSEGNPVLILRKNGHILAYEVKEITLDKYTRLLQAMTASREVK